MLLSSRLLILSLLFLPHLVWAFGEISFGAQLGRAGVGISNDDGTMAYYDGLTFQGSTGINLVNAKKLSTSLNLNLNYLDVENRASTGGQREAGKHLGAGADLGVRLYRFTAGYSYLLVDAKHYWVGDTNNAYVNFQYTKSGWYAGLDFNIARSTKLGLIYTSQSASLPKDKFLAGKDLSMEERTIFIRVSVSTSETLADFFSYIFGAKKAGR